jgi:hypothetical protein
MTASCGPGHLCDSCREIRRQLVAERLALLDGYRRTAPDSSQAGPGREKPADGG